MLEESVRWECNATYTYEVDDDGVDDGTYCCPECGMNLCPSCKRQHTYDDCVHEMSGL